MTRGDPGEGGTMPNFLVIGAMKAGTTSLYHYLREHPDVFMASIKETDFFASGGNWHRGLGWYRKQFEGSDGATAVGEASTAYTKHPVVAGVPERIAATIPSCRLIYVLREPVERIRSHYQHRVAVGTERAPLAEAVFTEPVYLTCSRYAAQVERYLECFPREQLLLITSEELRSSRRETMHTVFAFLGVDPEVVPPTIDQEFYRTQARATYSPILWRLRHAVKERVPAAKRAKELVDSTLPGLLRAGARSSRGAGAGPTPPVEIDGDVRARLAALLRDDVTKLRAYMPPGFDGWGIAGDERRPAFDVDELRRSGRVPPRGSTEAPGAWRS